METDLLTLLEEQERLWHALQLAKAKVASAQAALDEVNAQIANYKTLGGK